MAPKGKTMPIHCKVVQNQGSHVFTKKRFRGRCWSHLAAFVIISDVIWPHFGHHLSHFFRHQIWDLFGGAWLKNATLVSRVGNASEGLGGNRRVVSDMLYPTCCIRRVVSDVLYQPCCISIWEASGPAPNIDTPLSYNAILANILTDVLDVMHHRLVPHAFTKTFFKSDNYSRDWWWRNARIASGLAK